MVDHDLPNLTTIDLRLVSSQTLHHTEYIKIKGQGIFSTGKSWPLIAMNGSLLTGNPPVVDGNGLPIVTTKNQLHHGENRVSDKIEASLPIELRRPHGLNYSWSRFKYIQYLGCLSHTGFSIPGVNGVLRLPRSSND